MHNGDPVAVHAEMTAPGVDNLKAITFLLPDVSRPQLIGVEEFNDLTFKEHEKISFFRQRLDYVKPPAEPANGFAAPN